MTEDLTRTLAEWTAPPLSDTTRCRIDALLDDGSRPGPHATAQTSTGLLSIAYAVAVGILVVSVVWGTPPASDQVHTRHHVSLNGSLVVIPGLPAASQMTTTAVSAVELHGFEPIMQPRIRVNGRPR